MLICCFCVAHTFARLKLSRSLGFSLSFSLSLSLTIERTSRCCCLVIVHTLCLPACLPACLYLPRCCHIISFSHFHKYVLRGICCCFYTYIFFVCSTTSALPRFALWVRAACHRRLYDSVSVAVDSSVAVASVEFTVYVAVI